MKETVNFDPSTRFNPLDDFLFLKVMGEKGDEKQLCGFLNAVLGRSGMETIKSVDILDNKSFVKDIMTGKSCILDVLAVLEDGTKVNIEVQLSNENNMAQRSLFYWGKVYTNGINEGENYQELDQVITINIVDFDFPPRDKVHTCFHIWEDEDRTLMLDSVLEIHFINMVKWRKQADKDIANDPLHRWLVWFDRSSPSELVEEVINMDIAIKTASEKQAFLVAQDWEIRDYLRRREMFELDKLSQLSHARREGREEKTYEIARNALAEGASAEFVQKITGLDLETIKNL